MRIRAVAAAIAPVFLLSLAYVSFRSCGDRLSVRPYCWSQQNGSESARVRRARQVEVAGSIPAIRADSISHDSRRHESARRSTVGTFRQGSVARLPQTSLHRKAERRADDLLWAAICQVESGGDPNAYNEREDAAGVAQIREIYLHDANRILSYESFRLPDRFDQIKSRQIFEIVTGHYSRSGSDEERARIHNGGPRGMQKRSTVKYWVKVQKAMEDLR